MWRIIWAGHLDANINPISHNSIFPNPQSVLSQVQRGVKRSAWDVFESTWCLYVMMLSLFSSHKGHWRLILFFKQWGFIASETTFFFSHNCCQCQDYFWRSCPKSDITFLRNIPVWRVLTSIYTFPCTLKQQTHFRETLAVWKCIYRFNKKTFKDRLFWKVNSLWTNCMWTRHLCH